MGRTAAVKKRSVPESAEKTTGAIPELDATQKEVIATLTSAAEFWQTNGAYDPLRSEDSIESRYKAGEAIRKQVPRESHAKWKPPELRPSGVDFVIAGNAGRQEELVPLRMGRMAASPFAFLRGAAAVMAWDLSHTAISGLQVVIDGDAHINNFGLYGTASEMCHRFERFDEAIPGP